MVWLAASRGSRDMRVSAVEDLWLWSGVRSWSWLFLLRSSIPYFLELAWKLVEELLSQTISNTRTMSSS